MDHNTKILIVGGGIGGITLAYWLHQHGFQPTVVERVQEFGDVGFGLGLTGHSLEILDKMALTPALVEKAYTLPDGIMMTDQGRILKRFSMERFTNIEQGAVGLNRADLHKILYSAVENKIDFRFGRSVKNLTDTGSGVDVVFDSDTTETFDIVLGVDGIHSTVREMIFGTGFEQYFNIAYMSFMVPNMGIPAANHDVFGDGRMVTVSGCTPTQVASFFLFKATPGQQMTPDMRKAKLLELFGGFKWRVLEVIQAIADPAVIFYDDLAQIQMPTWTKGRIALLGDAAYCLSPLSGKGASMAIFGAHYLAEQLANYEYVEAFANYQTRMYAGIARFQKETFGFGKTVLPEGRIPVFRRNLVTQLMPNRFIYRLFTKEITERI